jgi:hypothetical protein
LTKNYCEQRKREMWKEHLTISLQSTLDKHKKY